MVEEEAVETKNTNTDNDTDLDDDADLFELAHMGARENRPYLANLLKNLKTEEDESRSALSQMLQKKLR